LAAKDTTFCVEVTFRSPSPTPLLTALTPSASEHEVSGGESRVSRQVALPHNLRAPRSKPKMASLYFWRPSQDSCHGAMAELPVSYSASTVPTPAREIAVSIRTAGCACFACSACRALSLRPPSTSCTISTRLPLQWQEKGYCRRAGRSR
jgi:hypothetical protein